jgi:hypothetical protein
MIAFFDLDLNEIAQSSGDYPWPRPCCCGRCGHPKVWGHGLVAIIFEGFAAALKIRRYRCPMCGCIIRLRPKGYFKRHQSKTTTIYSTLSHRLTTGCWPAGCVANRSRHWLASLRRNALAVFGFPSLDDLMTAFDRLVELGRVPVSRAV